MNFQSRKEARQDRALQQRIADVQSYKTELENANLYLEATTDKEQIEFLEASKRLSAKKLAIAEEEKKTLERRLTGFKSKINKALHEINQ